MSVIWLLLWFVRNKIKDRDKMVGSKLGHKEANAIIRKYNSQMSIKNYSKMSISNKIKAIETHIRKTHTSSPIRKEYQSSVNRYARRMEKERSEAKKKYSGQQTGTALAKLPKAPKKKKKKVKKKPQGKKVSPGVYADGSMF